MLRNSHFVSRIVMILAAAISATSCGGTNLYEELANKDREEAYLIEAQDKINSGDYDTALSYLDRINSGFRQDPRVISAIVGANLGKCGALSFIEILENMGTAGGSTPFMMFMNMFQNEVVSPINCYYAQLALESKYGTNSTVRSGDNNLYMAILGIVKMGTYLRDLADQDQDGTTDAAFMTASYACTAGIITDDNIQQIGSGLGMLLDNLASLIAATGGTSTLTDLDTLKTACGATCVITDPTSATWAAGGGAAINTIRDILSHQDTGISNCPDATFVTCCP